MHINISLSVLKKNLKILSGQVHLEKNQTLLDVIKELDAFLAKEKAKLDKKLVHFLQNRSYKKAMDFIEANESEDSNYSKSY